MERVLSWALVWAAGLAQLAAGYFISIDANEEQCFFDRVSSGVKMGLMFEVFSPSIIAFFDHLLLSLAGSVSLEPRLSDPVNG